MLKVVEKTVFQFSFSRLGKGDECCIVLRTVLWNLHGNFCKHSAVTFTERIMRQDYALVPLCLP